MSEHPTPVELTRSLIKLERLNHLYSMLSHINRTIVRAESPNDIYTNSCRIAVEDGNFRFALIALVAPQEQKLVTVATAGALIDLQWLPACINEKARGEPCIINQVHSDDRVARNRNSLVENGILAFASFPLFLENSVVGLIAVGIDEAGYFGDTELHLMKEVSEDISFTIDVLHRDEKRLAGETKLHYLAYYDPRTGLPGRPLFEERLTTIHEQHPQSIISVMVICLRNYHDLLKILGQNVAVIIDRAIAGRIESLMPSALVARIGEAEYALALESQEGLHQVEETAWHIHRSIVETIIVDKQEVFLEAFIGIAMLPKDGGPAEVVKAALTATDRAPMDNNGSCCRFFVPGMDSLSRRRLDLDTALRHAISRQEFELYYQPQVDLISGQIVGAEALLRWQRPDIGLVQPDEFIPMLEETGLINAVGEWALFEACAACRRWQEQGLPPVRIAVNLSGHQFRTVDIEVLVRRVLQETGLDPHWLELEVTENIILPNAARIIRTLRDLKAIGVNQALDDFGTGYSSLSYLQRLPVQRLKVDRSFVANITSNPSDAAIVRAVVSMAHSLGIRVIAEGAETAAQLGYLRGLSCDEMQGYHFSPPMKESNFVTLLRESRSIRIKTEQSKHKRVLLLVDDDPNILYTLRRALRRTDILVLATTNPNEGFELLAVNPVSVVVCDQRMPEMTGTEFLRRVKELFPATVRILLSSYTDLNSVIDAVNRGAVYKFLTKPVDDEILLDSLEDAFHLHEIERDNIILTRQLNDLLTAEKANGGMSTP
ncbi:MAG: EAL domain-containing protein [Candidatus Thiodiazotropha sp.]|jgi:EAL domain-containing protein (putative c-di-GMP-specific phosphodiesterase class I)/PleD family two-component response regulator